MRRRRARLNGWWRYLPFVLTPFAILFSEVWFRTQILNNEYQKNALRSSIRQTEERVDQLKDDIRELERMERVLERAPDLGLVAPEPGQVVEVPLASNPEPRGTQTVTAVPVPPARVPVAVAQVKKEAAPPELEELELLEPEVEWIE